MFKFTGIGLIILVVQLNYHLICADNGPTNLNLVPLWRLHRTKDNYHFIATEHDANVAVSNHGFYKTNIIGSVIKDAPSIVNELNSIHRNYRPDVVGKNDHLFTYSKSEVNLAVNMVGYVYEGIRFYCARKAHDFNATIPLHRFWTGVRHLYTTNFDEGNAIVAAGGKYEDVLCYLWQ